MKIFPLIFYPSVGHPAIATNAEEAAKRIKDFVNQHITEQPIPLQWHNRAGNPETDFLVRAKHFIG